MLKRASVALAATVPVLLLAGCGSNASSDNSASENSTSDATGTTSAACSYPSGGQAAKDVKAPPSSPSVSGTVDATMKTSAGVIGLALDAGIAPCTVNSFVSLAKQGYFDGTSCHRLTTAGIYVLQCGDPTGTGSGGPGYSFGDELDGAKQLKTDAEATKQYQAQGGTGDVKTYAAGTVAMANAGPGTNGSQFFLVYRDSALPAAYSVFGTIDAAGLKTLDAVAAAGTSNGSQDGSPKTPVDITSVAIG